MGALPKRRISTKRKGTRRQDKNVSLSGRNQYKTKRERQALKRESSQDK